MSSVRPLAERLRRLAPEALAFGAIGAVNSLLYLVITYVALPIGAVKATVLATVITTTLAYFANRFWTYRHHARRALRREYTLFFGFNLAGMVIQSGGVAIAKYGFDLDEETHKLLFMGVSVAGICVATVFRFWAYRTFVFLKQPVDGHEHEIAEMDVVAGLAELSTTDAPADTRTASDPLDAELATELDAARRADRH